MKTLSLAGIRTSQQFARLLHTNSLVRHKGHGVEFLSPTALRIDFAGMGRLALEDMCVLLLLVRRTAEDGGNVEICWPTQQNRDEVRRRRFLARIGFSSALRNPDPGSEWRQRIRFDSDLGPEVDDWHDINKLAEDASPYLRNVHMVDTSYIRLTFFDRTSFVDVSDYWRARPTVKPALAHRFRGMLNRGGYLDEEATNALLGTLFLELGWNTVLHAGIHPGEGYGVFCAQILPGQTDRGKPRQDLHFCVADLGLGIAETLRDAYRKHAPSSIQDLGASYASRAILFSLTPQGSRRRIHISASDHEAHRGLSHVADLLGNWGELSIRSVGGTVRLGRGDHPSLIDELRRMRLPGTQAAGVLRERSIREVVTYTTPKLDWSEDVTIVHVVAHAGQWLGIGTQEEADATVSSLRNLRHIVAFDCGYIGGPIRQLEYLIKAAVRLLSAHQIVLWNVQQEIPLFHHLSEWISTRLIGGQKPLLVARSPTEAAVIGRELSEALVASFLRALDVTVSQGSDGEPTTRICNASIPLETYYALSKRVNSSFLRRGFVEAGPREGFFQGRIHLMAGRTVGRFFALLRHLEASEYHVLRWAIPIASKIREWVSQSDAAAGPVIIIGFTYPVRALLDTISRKLLRDVAHSAYTLLSYDVPTEDEIGSIVSERSRVFLLTDVISTGSLVRAVETAVARNRGQLSGCIALVDAQTEAVDLVSPRFSLAQMESAEADVPLQEMWVDPVSMVPMPSTLWDTEIDPRVENTVDLLVRTGSVQSGHFVDGTRHSSISLDIALLVDRAEHQLLETVGMALAARLSARGWSDFQPTHQVFPAGIGRIEPVRDQSGTPVMNYYTAVRHVSELVYQIWNVDWTEIEVPRVFDPDGRPHCAAAVPLLPPSSDVLIIDDGMWTGRTAIELARSVAVAGAARICILPLVARMTASDLRFWEGLQRLGTTPQGDPIEVCFVFPLFLPVPYYTEQTCPYEVTLNRFRYWIEQDEFLSTPAQSLAKRLRVQRPYGGIRQSSKFIEAWLVLRTMSELAAENQAALELLRDRIDEIDQHGDPDSLDALFSLFLEEWRLLRRPRLRQIVSPQISAIATRWIRSPDVPDQVRQTAISLLRSLFPEAFVDELENLVQAPMTGPDILERSLYHAFTLRDELRGDARVRRAALNVVESVIPKLSSKYSDGTADDALMRTRLIATKLLQDKPRFPVTFDVQSSAEELVSVYADFVLSHRTSRRLWTMMGWERKEPGSVRSETFSTALADWREDRLYLEAEIVPRLAAIRPLLLDSRRQYLPSDDPAVSYLLGADAGSRRGIQGEFVALEFQLERLATNAEQPRLVSAVSAAARRIYETLTEPNCITRLLLSHHFADSTKTLIDSAVEELNLVEAAVGGVKISVEVDDRLDMYRPMFCPAHVWSYCVASVAANLRQHAFSRPYESAEPHVLIRAGIKQIQQRRYAVVSFLNNGAGLDEEVRSGSMALVDSVMRRYGGRFEGCFHANEPSWTVVIQASVPFSNLRRQDVERSDR